VDKTLCSYYKYIGYNYNHMLKIFIILVLLLIIYQFAGQLIEGLEGDSSSGSDSADSGGGGGGNCGMSLTDRNVFLLNDRVNALQTQYTDLSGNMAILNKQMEEIMKQNEAAASEMVGNTPLDISTGDENVPETVGGDTGGDMTATTEPDTGGVNDTPADTGQ
jgi:hypothetical protein